MKHRLFSFSVLILLGFGFGLVSSELLVREFVPLSDFLWEFDPFIGMRLVPGKSGRSVKLGIYDTPVVVNSVGFRDRDHTVDKPAGVRRIALLGDSVVEA